MYIHYISMLHVVQHVTYQNARLCIFILCHDLQAECQQQYVIISSISSPLTFQPQKLSAQFKIIFIITFSEPSMVLTDKGHKSLQRLLPLFTFSKTVKKSLLQKLCKEVIR
jgi:hypothetical protein